ncbi:MAG: type I restriction enzyme HsdR N-terminal domain-containing protein [Sphingomonadales bacterium]
MEALLFPTYEFTIQTAEQKKQIFDPVRKKFIPLTPEEWVRQHVIMHLHHHYRIAFSLISVERELQFNGLKKRFDVMVSCRNRPFACLVEVKAPEIKLTTETILQAAVYNKSYNCPWLWVTNGIQHAWLLIENGTLKPAEAPIGLCGLP